MTTTRWKVDVRISDTETETHAVNRLGNLIQIVRRERIRNQRSVVVHGFLSDEERSALKQLMVEDRLPGSRELGS